MPQRQQSSLRGTPQKLAIRQFLPRGALCALRGIATVSRPSVRLFVCLSLCNVEIRCNVGLLMITTFVCFHFIFCLFLVCFHHWKY